MIQPILVRTSINIKYDDSSPPGIGDSIKYFTSYGTLAYIYSDHLCYIYLAGFTSPADLSPESQDFVP